MARESKEKIAYPIKQILESVAEYYDIELRQFTKPCFFHESEEGEFPYLADLSKRLSFNYEAGIEIRDYGMEAFEGSNFFLSLAYFNREFEDLSDVIKENALILHNGRKVYIKLCENGNGYIELIDSLAIEAAQELGFGYCFGGVSATLESGFRSPSLNPHLPELRNFVYHLTGVMH